MEPERPIEKVLRAWGEKRREEAEAMEMHPATRKLLQGEVTRKFARAKAATAPSQAGWFRGLPRWAWGAASVAALGICVALIAIKLNPHDDQVIRFAKNESSSAYLSENKTAEAIPPPAADVAGALASADKLDDANAKNARSAGGRDQDLLAMDDRKPATEKETSLSLQSERPMTQSNNGEIASAAPSVKLKSENAPGGIGGGNSVTVSGPPPASAAAPSASVTDPEVFSRRYGLSRNGMKDAVESGSSAPATVGGMADGPPHRALTPSTSGLAAAKPERQPGFSNAPSGIAVYKSIAPNGAVADLSATTSAKEPTHPLVTERFAQVVANGNRTRGFTDKLSSPAPVLNSFQIEQNGNTVRVVDADGSEYLGEVQPSVPAQTRSANIRRSVALPSAAAARKKSESANLETLSNTNTLPDTFAFRVVGTNKSINQKVVFSGTLINSTNSGARLGVDGAGTRGVARQQTYWFEGEGRRITGRATVGAGGEKQIEAVRVP